mgnify:CR=1 FL=1
MNEEVKLQLKKTANQVRADIIEQVHSAKAGHPGGSLSVADILTYLYFVEMNIDPKKPDWEDRDRFVLSKGHTCPALYSVLARRGFFDPEILPTFRHIGSILQGHPDMKKIPGVDMSSGSLGQGISAACGMALAAKKDGKNHRIYTILGDGEIEEGQVWEAMMFAAHYKLDNFCIIVDNNGLQIDGPTAEVMNSAPIAEKGKAFGLDTFEMDAHDFDSIEKAIDAAKKCVGKPALIVANSVKGKGVSYMENSVDWHGKAPDDELYAVAMNELKEAAKCL